MVPSEELERLDSELEHHKQELRRDMAQIHSNVSAVRETVTPRGLVSKKPLLITGLAMLAGFIFGYRGGVIAQATGPVLMAGRPVAKAALTSAATQAASRA